MAVFPPNTMFDIANQARRLASNFFNAHPLTVTAEEFVDGFIDPDHIGILRQTEEICGKIGNTSNVTFAAKTNDGHGFDVMISFTSMSPIIIPEYASYGLRPTAPAKLRERFQDWIEQRWTYGCTFGDVNDAIYFLNEVCVDARAMTVMLPILPTLMRNITVEADSRTSKRAKRLAELKSVGTLPSLPRAVTKRIQEACHLMTAVNLIENVAAPKVEKGGGILHHLAGYKPIKRPNMFAGLAHMGKDAQGTFF